MIIEMPYMDENIMCSSILQHTQVSETGKQLPAIEWSPSLSIGVA